MWLDWEWTEKGNLALAPRCAIRGGYLRSRQAFMHLEFQLSWLISILHGVQTSTEHLGHVGAEGDEKYVTG